MSRHTDRKSAVTSLAPIQMRLTMIGDERGAERIGRVIADLLWRIRRTEELEEQLRALAEEE